LPKKKNQYINAKDTLVLLRSEAEKAMSGNEGRPDPQLQSMDIKDLLHNIQIQQIELEMQNDELKISNEELELQRAKFAGLFDLAPVGYFILNNFGVIEEVNTIGLQLLDMPKKNVLHRRFQNLIAINETTLFTSFLNSLRYTDNKHTCQLTMQIPGGKTFHAQVQGIATQKSTIDSTRYYIGVIDITDRINDALTLSKANERLNIALNASSAGTWEINLKSGRIFLDNYSKNILGFTHANFDGRSDTFLGIIHHEDRERVQSQLLLALDKESELDIDYRVTCPDGKTKYVAVRGHVVYVGKDLNSFVGIVMDIDHKKQLENEAQALKLSQHKTITAATLQAQEKERKRISEALHDSVSQLLYGIKLNLQNLDKDDERSKKVHDLLELAIQETRNIAFELAPSVLTDFGLPITIDEMCKRLNNSKLNIKLIAHGLQQRLDPAAEISIFRIIQELVNNCIKHAEATVIRITLVKKDNTITIEVQDNGNGFIYHDNETYLNGSGLASIKNRISLFNGTLQVNSTPGKGTKVLITLKEATHQASNNGYL
jgi:PAS domain S-box-containing protein